MTGDDWARLANQAERLAHFIGHRAFMHMENGHCVALEIRRPAGRSIEFFCTIYERRPQTCRDLQRGSPQCVAERDVKLAEAGKWGATVGVDCPGESQL